MTLVPDDALAYIGLRTTEKFASECVERGAVRRFAQATMDDDPAYCGGSEANDRYGGPVAPPLFPQWMFRREFGEPDPIQDNAHNEDFDGAAVTGIEGLPPIEPFRGFGILNGGAEIELYRYARHGDRVKVTSRYEDIFEKQGRKGPIALIIIASEYRTEDGELLLVIRRTSIRTPV